MAEKKERLCDEIKELLVEHGYINDPESNPEITIFVHPNRYGGYEDAKVEVAYVEHYSQNSSRVGF